MIPMKNNARHEKAVRIVSVAGIRYKLLWADHGTEYGLDDCPGSVDAETVYYQDTIHLDGKAYTLTRYRGEWNISQELKP